MFYFLNHKQALHEDYKPKTHKKEIVNYGDDLICMVMNMPTDFLDFFREMRFFFSTFHELKARFPGGW